MRLEDVTAKIRPRGRWEAIDMGCAMARRSYGTIMMAWLLTVWPMWIVGVYVLGTFMSPGWHLFCSALWCWLTLQVAGKVPLYVMSRKLFGEDVSVYGVFKEWWKSGLYKNFFSRVRGRFSVTRGLSLPVAELEGLKGHAYKARVNLLARNGGDGASQAVMVCWLMQIVMIASGYFFVGLVYGLYGETDVLEMLTIDLARYGDDYAGWWLFFLFYLMSVTIIEPFFVGAGFAMYVNSRTVTEGWDIELIFKRINERLKSLYVSKKPADKPAQKAGGGWTGGGKSWLLAMGISLCVFGLSSPIVEAGDERVDKILKSEDFDLNRGTYQEFVSSKKGSSGLSSRSGSYSRSYSSSSVGDVSGLFSGVFVMLFWSGIVIALAAVIWVIYKNRKALNKGELDPADDDRKKVKSVMGMDVTPESLPKEIHEEARDAWKRGEQHLALSLLYRGAISWMVNQARVPIVESDTEEDCLRRVKTMKLTTGQYFKGVTNSWVGLAYGKKLPADEEVMGLCDQWPFAEKIAKKEVVASTENLEPKSDGGTEKS